MYVWEGRYKWHKTVLTSLKHNKTVVLWYFQLVFKYTLTFNFTKYILKENKAILTYTLIILIIAINFVPK